jgi:hypothetical protein
MGTKSRKPCINIPTHMCSRVSLDEKFRLSIPFLSTSQMTSHLWTELNEDVECFRCVIVLTVYCSQGWVQKYNWFSKCQVKKTEEIRTLTPRKLHSEYCIYKQPSNIISRSVLPTLEHIVADKKKQGLMFVYGNTIEFAPQTFPFHSEALYSTAGHLVSLSHWTAVTTLLTQIPYF